MGRQKKPRSKQTKKKKKAAHAIFCNTLEMEYPHVVEAGMFDVLKIMELDEEHSNKTIVAAVNYFKSRDGEIKSDAPIDFLSPHEQTLVQGEGEFRPELYCMLLSSYFAEAVEKKTVFLKHSYRFGFNDM